MPAFITSLLHQRSPNNLKSAPSGSARASGSSPRLASPVSGSKPALKRNKSITFTFGRSSARHSSPTRPPVPALPLSPPASPTTVAPSRTILSPSPPSAPPSPPAPAIDSLTAWHTSLHRTPSLLSLPSFSTEDLGFDSSDEEMEQASAPWTPRPLAPPAFDALPLPPRDLNLSYPSATPLPSRRPFRQPIFQRSSLPPPRHPPLLPSHCLLPSSRPPPPRPPPSLPPLLSTISFRPPSPPPSFEHPTTPTSFLHAQEGMLPKFHSHGEKGRSFFLVQALRKVPREEESGSESEYSEAD